MNSTAPHYTSDLRIKDARFSIDYLQEYSLLLQAGEQEFQLAVVDTKTNRCLLLELYTFHHLHSEEEYQQLIEALFEEHHLLMAGFWHSVRFCVKNSRFSLVPAALFDKEELKHYLRLTSPLLETDEHLYYRHLKNNLVTVFSAEEKMLHWLKRRYANLNVQVLHHISAFTEGVLHQPDHSSQQRDLFVLQENNMLSVVMALSGKLQYANLFHCSTPADMLRYLMMIVKQFDLDQSSTKLLMWGEITPSSDWFKKINPYFGNLSFGNRPAFLNFNFMFDEVPEQRFFDLFSLHLCE